MGSNDLSISIEKCTVRHLRAALAEKQRETLGELIQKQQKKFSFAPPGLELCLSITSVCIAVSHMHPCTPAQKGSRREASSAGAMLICRFSKNSRGGRSGEERHEMAPSTGWASKGCLHCCGHLPPAPYLEHLWQCEGKRLCREWEEEGSLGSH